MTSLYINKNGTKKALYDVYANINGTNKQIYPNKEKYKISTYKATSFTEQLVNDVPIHCAYAYGGVYGNYSFNSSTGKFSLYNNITNKLVTDDDGEKNLPSGVKGYIIAMIYTSTSDIPCISTFSYVTSDGDYRGCDYITGKPTSFSSIPWSYYYSTTNDYPSSLMYDNNEYDYTQKYTDPGIYYRYTSMDGEDNGLIYYPGKVEITRL